MISSKHLLSKAERNLLYRCIHSDEVNRSVKLKVRDKVFGEVLVIDFYNLTTTVSEALEGYSVYRSTDFFVRDIAASFGRSKKDCSTLLKAFRVVLDYLVHESIQEILLVLDKQVSHSKMLGEKALELTGSFNLKCNFILSSKTDVEVSKQANSLDGIAISSDILVLLRSSKVQDLAGKVISRIKPETIVEFWSVVF